MAVHGHPARAVGRLKRVYGVATERDARFLRDVLDGLRAEPRSLPSKYFYDADGSALFERITTLDAYYPTRTERAILERNAGEIAASVGPGVVLIEFGSGSSSKTRIVLDALDDVAAYVPIDISSEFMQDSVDRLHADYPELSVVPVVADYALPFEPPTLPAGPRLLFFPGSTIGNFEHEEATAFLRRASRLAGAGGMLLLGVDLEKDAAILERAYDDPEGVTAEFNRNLLVRINRELGADFDPEAFRHSARYDSKRRRVEMHLVAQRDHAVTVSGEEFSIRAGESIHTENAYKYRVETVESMAARAGFALKRIWTDDRCWFAVLLFDVA